MTKTFPLRCSASPQHASPSHLNGMRAQSEPIAYRGTQSRCKWLPEEWSLSVLIDEEKHRGAGAWTTLQQSACTDSYTMGRWATTACAMKGSRICQSPSSIPRARSRIGDRGFVGWVGLEVGDATGGVGGDSGNEAVPWTRAETSRTSSW